MLNYLIKECSAKYKVCIPSCNFIDRWTVQHTQFYFTNQMHNINYIIKNGERLWYREQWLPVRQNRYVMCDIDGLVGTRFVSFWETSLPIVLMFGFVGSLIKVCM
jgi:hypothetical protein